MILTEVVYVTITHKNFLHFKSKGYNIPIGYSCLVNVSDLNKGSHSIIKCKCDDCGIEKEIMFKIYLRYKNNYGDYKCRKCSQKKIEETNLKLYGVKYPLQKKEILKKMEKTVIEKYKVNNVAKIKKQIFDTGNTSLFIE